MSSNICFDHNCRKQSPAPTANVSIGLQYDGAIRMWADGSPSVYSNYAFGMLEKNHMQFLSTNVLIAYPS